MGIRTRPRGLGENRQIAEVELMAKILGKAGGNLEERAINHRKKGMMVMFFLMCGVFFLIGFATAKMNYWWFLIAALIILPAYIIFERLFDKLIRLARKDESGASGEKDIARFLEQLPNTYTVINDLEFADSYGNIDHLVVGPTGIFAIDVKNWRGTVSADGKGELLHNGRPTEKPNVKNFTRRIMDLKERIHALTKLDRYIQCVFVFPHTQIEAKWGTTSAVHCINADQIEGYITKGQGGRPLFSDDISRILSSIIALQNSVQEQTCSAP